MQQILPTYSILPNCSFIFLLISSATTNSGNFMYPYPFTNYPRPFKERHLSFQNGPLPFTKTEYVIGWLFRECTSFYLLLRAHSSPILTWRSKHYLVKSSAQAEEIHIRSIVWCHTLACAVAKVRKFTKPERWSEVMQGAADGCLLNRVHFTLRVLRWPEASLWCVTVLFLLWEPILTGIK